MIWCVFQRQLFWFADLEFAKTVPSKNLANITFENSWCVLKSLDWISIKVMHKLFAIYCFAILDAVNKVSYLPFFGKTYLYCCMMNSSDGYNQSFVYGKCKSSLGCDYFVEYNNEKSTTNFLFVQCFIFLGGGGLKRN